MVGGVIEELAIIAVVVILVVVIRRYLDVIMDRLTVAWCRLRQIFHKLFGF